MATQATIKFRGGKQDGNSISHRNDGYPEGIALRIVEATKLVKDTQRDDLANLYVGANYNDLRLKEDKSAEYYYYIDTSDLTIRVTQYNYDNEKYEEIFRGTIREFLQKYLNPNRDDAQTSVEMIHETNGMLIHQSVVDNIVSELYKKQEKWGFDNPNKPTALKTIANILENKFMIGY